MSSKSYYPAEINWERGQQVFLDQRYSRDHYWHFDNGLTIPASASPHIVAPPLSDPGQIDPEQAFVAALSSCHMLWFLSIAAEQGYCVDRYRDRAQGVLAANAQGQMAMTEIKLRPEVLFSQPNQPEWSQILQMHDQAHHACFLANSVTSVIRCEPVASTKNIPA